ncbi:MAG: glycerate kinase [Nocardioidaceae bacterium]|nr:glycerate kinase [Nocardioidaceae bacterium]
MHVLIAPDKFKGSLSASQVARHLSTGLAGAAPGVTVAEVPVADGGDGTLNAALSAGFRRVAVTAEGPTGERVDTAYAERDGVAVVELADVSGLSRLPGGQPAPLTASSFGTGQVLRAALDHGCRRVILGVGGSACTDGGAGIVQALGGRLVTAGGVDLPGGGAALADLDQVDLAGLHPALRSVELVVACDVDNPLLGEHGAAAVYGPQKGASAGDVLRLDAALTRWAQVLRAATGLDQARSPGAGAAGGVGFAALAVLGATLRSGIELVLELVAFPEQLASASLVVTGEGSLDAQTLRGKAPAGVAAAARAAGVPTVAVAGRTLLLPDQLSAAGIAAVYALTDLEPDLTRCMSDAGRLLEQLAGQVAHDWLTAGSSLPTTIGH